MRPQSLRAEVVDRIGGTRSGPLSTPANFVDSQVRNEPHKRFPQYCVHALPGSLPDPLVRGRNLIRSVRVKLKGFLVRFDRKSIFSPAIEASLEEFDT